MKTERLVILVTPTQKRTITARAKALEISTAEVVRRAVEDYQPDSHDEQTLLNALAGQMEVTSREASAALQEAREEMRKTLAYFADKNSPVNKSGAV